LLAGVSVSLASYTVELRRVGKGFASLAYVDAAFVGVGVTEKFASNASRSSRKLESKVAVPVDGHFVFLEHDSKPNLLLLRTPNRRLKS